jgi:hypothetical protein
MSPNVAHIRCSVPEAIEVEVMLRLNQFGGMITSVEREADSRASIGATVPRKQVADFKAWLHGHSNGLESFSEDQT